MSTKTRPITSFKEIFKSLFGSGTDIIEYNEEDLPPELRKVVDSIDTRSVEACVVSVSSSSKKGGFGKKINPNTEKARRAMYKEIQPTLDKDRERE